MNKIDDNKGTPSKTTATNDTTNLDKPEIDVPKPETDVPHPISENPTFPEEMPLREYK